MSWKSMNKIVVDTNILFSTLLNTDSRIAQILFNGRPFYDFYAPEYVRTEIFEHKERLIQLTGISENEFLELYELVIKNVNVLYHSLIPAKIYLKAEKLCRSIDIDDTVFIAVTEFLKGRLWTGDKKLMNGLALKGFTKMVKTEDLYREFLMKERTSKKF